MLDAESQESLRMPYLVVPHSALSPVENKEDTRGTCYVFVGHIKQTAVSAITDGF